MKKETLTLYHGTIEESFKSIYSNGVDLNIGKERVDNGKGFYTTPDIYFAIRSAKWKARPGEKRVVVQLEIDARELLGLPRFRVMKNPNKEWAQFIVNNRAGYTYMQKVNSFDHNISSPPQYDAIYNRVADKRILRFVMDLQLNPRLVNDNEVQSLISEKFTYQLSFHSPESLKCINDIQLAYIGEEALIW